MVLLKHAGGRVAPSPFSCLQYIPHVSREPAVITNTSHIYYG